jgi:hypothetical protein
VWEATRLEAVPGVPQNESVASQRKTVILTLSEAKGKDLDVSDESVAPQRENAILTLSAEKGKDLQLGDAPKPQPPKPKSPQAIQWKRRPLGRRNSPAQGRASALGSPIKMPRCSQANAFQTDLSSRPERKARSGETCSSSEAVENCGWDV